MPSPLEAYLARHPQTRWFEALFPDLVGMPRGKRLPIADAAKIFEEGMNFPVSAQLLDARGESHDPAGRGFSDGDPDCAAVGLARTLAPVPWAGSSTAQALLEFRDEDGRSHPATPRGALVQALGRLEALGLKPTVAFELEFNLIERERTPLGLPQVPRASIGGDRDGTPDVYGLDSLEAFAEVLEGIGEAAALQGIRTGAISTEYARGQFEINLHHSSDPLAAADDCILFRRVVRGVARQHGLSATFMAKPFADQAGNGLHLHLSLYDREGRNVFDGGGQSGPDSVSPTLLHAVGGLCETLPEAMALLAPNLNSYRRFKPNFFVPVTRSWGFENRSVAFRIPRGPGRARRIEHRVAGADANPYLALAGAVTGIAHGIEKRIEPPEPSPGNAGAALDPALPLALRPALERLEASPIMAWGLGADYPRLYAECKRRELEAFEQEISPAEYAWYLLAD